MNAIEQTKVSEDVLPDEIKKNKYQSQINYDKKRKEVDPEYRKKKNELVCKRNYEGYHSDPEFAQKIKDAAKLRTKRIMDIYKENKDVFKSLSCPAK